MSFLPRRAVVLLSVWLLAGCSVKQSTDPIQVAHLLPLTGPDKASAEDARRGMLLAVEDVNADGQRVVVLTDQRNPTAVALAAAFVQEWPRASPPTVEEWPFRNDTEQIDFASRLAKEAPPVALFAGTPADFLKLAGQLREEKVGVTLLYGGEDVGAEALRKAGVEALTATVYAAEGL